MKVYKYRGIDCFERDLKSLERNYFWAPTYDNLNDPFEEQSKMIEKIFGSISGFSTKEIEESLFSVTNKRFEMGIFSLSKTYNHELLWAHYGGSHYGFCIEYDLSKLLDNIYQKVYDLNVEYSNTPPSLNWQDLLKQDELGELSILKKIAGTKSLVWNYEEEIRLITDEPKEQYHEYDAITGIYFGSRMSKENKNQIMKRMKGRGIKYFDVELEEGSYSLKRKAISDLYEDSTAYLGFISEEERFKILNKSFNRFTGKASIDIELSSKIKNNKLRRIAIDIREKIFPMAERIFMNYYLPDTDIAGAAWATSHFREEKIEVSINGLTKGEEKELLKNLNNDGRKIIGRWLDNTPFVSSVRILFMKDGKIYFKTIFPDGTFLEEEMFATERPNGMRYDYKNDKNHTEYFIVNNKSELLFASESGVFRTVPLFESS